MATVKTSKAMQPASKQAKPANKKNESVAIGKNGPNMAYLQSMAKKLDVSGYSKFTKPELIHAIQQAEGNAACYERISDCTLQGCLFFSACQR